MDQTKMGATDPELVAYLRGFPGEKRVVMEACMFWEHTYDAAASVTSSAILPHPYKTRLNAETHLKTDEVDSETLAALPRLEAVPTAYAPPPEIRQFRDLVKERLFCLSK